MGFIFCRSTVSVAFGGGSLRSLPLTTARWCDGTHQCALSMARSPGPCFIPALAWKLEVAATVGALLDVPKAEFDFLRLLRMLRRCAADCGLALCAVALRGVKSEVSGDKGVTDDDAALQALLER